MFKLNDKVICIEAAKGYLVKDCVYRIFDILWDGSLELEGVKHSWAPIMFKIYSKGKK